MIFNTLYESAQRGELLLIEGGFCHFHLRRNGQLTIREIISTRRGAGREMLAILIALAPRTIVAKCPVALVSNGWYQHMGFEQVSVETTRSGSQVNVWKLSIAPVATAP